MAKRKGMGRYIKGSVDEELALTTLAAKTAVLVAFADTVDERTLISSLVANYSISNWTPTADVGPILVGIAHSDYDLAEIEAFIELQDSWSEANRVQREVSSRLIRKIGVFKMPSAADQSSVLNDGNPIRTKLNWILNEGQTLKVWCYNLGSAAVATTVPDFDIVGHANLWPR